jgi:hypothetical protein
VSALHYLFRLSLHVGAEDGVDAGLVAAASFFEPFHDVVVDPAGRAVFGFGCVGLAVLRKIHAAGVVRQESRFLAALGMTNFCTRVPHFARVGHRIEKPFIAASAPEGVIEEMAYGSPEGEP